MFNLTIPNRNEVDRKPWNAGWHYQELSTAHFSTTNRLALQIVSDAATCGHNLSARAVHSLLMQNFGFVKEKSATHVDELEDAVAFAESLSAWSPADTTQQHDELCVKVPLPFDSSCEQYSHNGNAPPSPEVMPFGFSDLSRMESQAFGGFGFSAVRREPHRLPVDLILEDDVKPSAACTELSDKRRQLHSQVSSDLQDNKLKRRGSFDANEMRSNFHKQVRQRKLNLRRRKSIDEIALTVVADEIRLIDNLKKAVGKTETCPVVLKRTNSLTSGKLIHNDCPFDFQTTTKSSERNRTLRIERLSQFSSVNIFECWPSSATTLLAGGQTITDRLLLFWHLEKVYKQFPRNPVRTNDSKHTTSNEAPTLRPVSSGRRFTLVENHSNNSLASLDNFGFVPEKLKSGLELVSGCYQIPHPDKTHGEDAHFTMDGCGAVLGVADGVGQWSEFGCDPSRFSRALMKGCLEAVLRRRAASMTISGYTNATARRNVSFTSDSSEFDSMELLDCKDEANEQALTARGGKRWASFTVGTSGRLAARNMGAAAHSIGTVLSHVHFTPNVPCSGGCHSNEAHVHFGVPTIASAAAVASGEYTREKLSKSVREVVAEGFETTEKIWGASTVIVAALDSAGESVGVASIGDSTMIVLRRDLRDNRLFSVIRRTREQQHSFNCPFQLSRIPRKEDHEALANDGHWALLDLLQKLGKEDGGEGGGVLDGDPPSSAELYDLKIMEGDLIVMGSDGLFDNLFDHEIAHIVSLCLSPYESVAFCRAQALRDAVTGQSAHPHFVCPPKVDRIFGIATPPKDIARALSEAAFSRSVDNKARTPFGKACRRLRLGACGGKLDDVTVVVAWAVGPSTARTPDF